MAVLLELSIFSISGEVNKREEVAEVLRAFKDKGVEAHLNPMGTVIECEDMPKALEVLQIAYDCMDTQRFYIIAKFDCYPQRENMLKGRVERVLERI